jgi:hypothetical protein
MREPKVLRSSSPSKPRSKEEALSTLELWYDQHSSIILFNYKVQQGAVWDALKNQNGIGLDDRKYMVSRRWVLVRGLHFDAASS